MKIYAYFDEDGVHTYTRQEILDAYYDSWKKKMIKVGKEHLISEDNCVQDWVVVNWAREVEKK